MRTPSLALLLVGAAGCVSALGGVGAPAASGLTLRPSSAVARDEARSKNNDKGFPQRLMRIKGGIAQSKHAAVITEGLGAGILTATAVLLGKTDLSAGLQALGVGGVLLSLIHSGNHISGANYNPAVTLATALLGKMDGAQAAKYVLSQVAGATGGAFLAKALVKSVADPSYALTAASGFPDALFSFALVLTVLQTAVARAQTGNAFFGLARASMATLGTALGCGMNPAVAVGLFAAAGTTKGLAARCGISLLGAAAAALAFKNTDVDEAGAKGLVPSASADWVRRRGPYLNELVGTFVLTGAIGVSLATGKLPVAVAAGLAVTGIASGSGYISGAHLNPAVSLGVHLRDKARFGADKLGGYATVQTLGAIAAAVATKHFLGAGSTAGNLPLPQSGYDWQHALTAEAIFTSLIVSTALHAGGQQLGALSVAGAVVSALFGSGIISGGGLNPAIAAALFGVNGGKNDVKENLWVYIVGPAIGALLGTASVQLTSPALGK